jgi:hypothetical protein
MVGRCVRNKNKNNQQDVVEIVELEKSDVAAWETQM